MHSQSCACISVSHLSRKTTDHLIERWHKFGLCLTLPLNPTITIFFFLNFHWCILPFHSSYYGSFCVVSQINFSLSSTLLREDNYLHYNRKKFIDLKEDKKHYFLLTLSETNLKLVELVCFGIKQIRTFTSPTTI